MVSPFRIAVDIVVVVAIAVAGVPALAGVPELATAQGTIAISDARPGLRTPSCGELVVEARGALDNHLIAQTYAAADNAGGCQYALSVPAQTAVWLRVQPVLVAGARVINGENMNNNGGLGRTRASSGSVALRFTIIAPATYFFTPNEQKTISLSY